MQIKSNYFLQQRLENHSEIDRKLVLNASKFRMRKAPRSQVPDMGAMCFFFPHRSIFREGAFEKAECLE